MCHSERSGESVCLKWMLSRFFALLRMTGLYPFPNLRMEEESYVLALCQALADEGRADFNQRRVDLLDRWRKSRFVYLISRTWIHQQVMTGDDLVRCFPTVEKLPIVCTDDEGELMVGIGFLQGIERMDGIGRTGQVEFEVRSMELGIAFHGQAYQFQAQVVIPKLVVAFQWIFG